MGTVDVVNVLLAQADLEDTCGANPSWICERLFEATDGNRVLAPLVDAVISIAVIFVIAWIASALAHRYFAGVVARVVAPDRTAASRHISKLGSRAGELVANPLGIDDVPDPRREARITSISAVVGSTTSIIIWSIAGVVAFGELGIQLAPLIAGLGIAGVALGFGAAESGEGLHRRSVHAARGPVRNR